MKLNLAQKILEDKECKKNMAKELQQLLDEEMMKPPAQRDYQEIAEITRTYCIIMGIDDWVKESSQQGIQDVLKRAEQPEKIDQDEQEKFISESDENPIIQHTRVFNILLTAAACLLVFIGGTAGIYVLNRFPQSDSAQPTENSTESSFDMPEFSPTETIQLPSVMEGTETTAQSNPATTSVSVQSGTAVIELNHESGTTISAVSSAESEFTVETSTLEEEILSTTVTTTMTTPQTSESESLPSSEQTETGTISLKKLTTTNIIALAKKGDALTWADFKQYQSEEISQYMLKYEIADDAEHYLLVCGETLEDTPDRILLESDDGMSMDIRSEEFQWFQFLYWMIWRDEPENDEANRETAKTIGEYALTELQNGTYTPETRISLSDAPELMNDEIAEVYQNSAFFYLSFVNEHTVLLKMNKGLLDAYGYLITDGSITFREGEYISVPNEFYDGDHVYVEWAGENLYYFSAGT